MPSYKSSESHSPFHQISGETPLSAVDAYQSQHDLANLSFCPGLFGVISSQELD
jgi:hypothetical protein